VEQRARAKAYGESFIGTWSANDLVAHLVGWAYVDVAGIRAVLAGRLPDFFNQYEADRRTFNAGLVARYKQPTLAETIAQRRLHTRPC
jgi:hypothetical protein